MIFIIYGNLLNSKAENHNAFYDVAHTKGSITITGVCISINYETQGTWAYASFFQCCLLN